MDQERIHNAVVKAQEAFWAVIAASFPEISTGDFPPDAQLVFDGACMTAATVWVTGNQPQPSLSEEELLGLGYEINDDSDQPGMFCWRNDQEGSEISYPTKAKAIAAASADAFFTYDLSRCDNCGEIHTDQTLVAVKKLSMRVEPGGTMPSGECPDCGALCYQI